MGDITITTDANNHTTVDRYDLDENNYSIIDANNNLTTLT